MPLRLEPLTAPPPELPDLSDINHTFIEAGGGFFVAEMAGGLVGMARSGPMSEVRLRCYGYESTQP